MKVLITMAISLHINEKDSAMELVAVRKQQYIKGIQRLLELVKDFPKETIDFHISDNTTNTLDIDIQNACPQNTIITCFINNKFGRINKGGGLMEVWLHNIALYAQYDYIIHFEPRTYLLSNLFFYDFFSRPRNLFTPGDKTGQLKNHVYTGLFALQPTHLMEYLQSVSPEYITTKGICIEDILAQKLIGKYDIIPYVDVEWSPARETRIIRF